MTEIKLIRLNDGKSMDLIAGYERTDTGIKLKSPHIIIFGQTEQGMNVKLIPFIPPYASEKQKEVEFEDSCVQCVFEPAEELMINFRKELSGLILPSGNSVQVPRVGVNLAS